MHGSTVECALMALEKWFYEKVENGHSIAPWVQHIYAHAQSLAFAGVLVSVGLKYPGHFTRELLPLLGNLFIYQYQLNWASYEQQETWSTPLERQGQPAIKLAVEWNSMPHRRLILQNTAPYLMLQDQATRAYLVERTVQWRKENEDNEKTRDDLKCFLARLDLQNYTETPQSDGRVLITMRWPSELEAKVTQAQDKYELNMLSLTLAMRARSYLSGQKTLELQELPEFVTQIQRLANWHPSDVEESQEQYRINSLAGGIAVLVVQHRAWLSQNPNLEEWCIHTLRQLKPVENSEYDTPVSASDHTAESFLGEAGVALLQESGEEWVLRMAFEGVTGFYYGSTFQTMWRAYLLREQLGDKFAELTNIVVLWSALRRGATRESVYQASRPLLAKYKETLFRRYVAGKLKGSLIPLRAAETLGRTLVERVSRKSMSSQERRMREAQRNSLRERRDDRELRREIPDVDFEE